eukprot:scaffold133765_cov60-Attheya_sp.AAC.11
MAPKQTALSTTTMSSLTTDATSHHPHSPHFREHHPCVSLPTAFSSKRRRLSSSLIPDTLTAPNPFGVNQTLPSAARHASSSGRTLPPTIPAVIRFYVPSCVIGSVPLPRAAVGGVSTVAISDSTIYHNREGNSLSCDTSMSRHIPQRIPLCPASATLPFRPYPSLVATNQARFYTYQPKPMGLNLSAFEWQSQLGHETIPPPLVIDPDDYNSDSSSVTNAMPHLSSPMLPGPPSRASA